MEQSFTSRILARVIAPHTRGGQSNGARAGLRALNIIVADDERDTVLTLIALLRLEGHEVRGFYGGSEVIEAARNEKPDAVILDIAMPGMSGYAVARELREMFGRRTPLLIACSGELTTQTDKMLGSLVGFDHYLVKPCAPEEILRLIAPLTQQ